MLRCISVSFLIQLFLEVYSAAYDFMDWDNWPSPYIRNTHTHTQGWSISPRAPLHSIIISVSSQTHTHIHTALLWPGTFRAFSCMWEHLKISLRHTHTHTRTNMHVQFCTRTIWKEMKPSSALCWNVKVSSLFVPLYLCATKMCFILKRWYALLHVSM